MQKVSFDRREFLIKRDDLLHKDFSGNKARKFWYFFVNDFPNINKIISYGSNQSNAMYSLSVLCKLKGWKFDYYVSHIPSFLKANPIGNYKYSLKNQMKIIEDSEIVDKLRNFEFETKDNELIIQEGGAIKEAEYGLKILAKELSKYEDYKIFLPSGTGTTALYLQKYSKQQIYTTPCVGDKEYLKKQFSLLESENHPIIINPPKKYHFGKLYKELYQLWQELKIETNIEFDLLYDPIGWITMLHNFGKDEKIIYIHQGGVLGNKSMLQRYERKGV